MAVITGTTFNKQTEIITIPIAETEATIQDLHDTICEWIEELQNMEIDQIHATSGKEELIGGVYVGLTMVIYDWKLSFAERPPPTWVECLVSGGNLVRFDTGTQSYTSPIEPTAYVSVTLAASSSATLQELVDIQHASFEGAVHIDVINGVAGTEYPIGTHRMPVDNLTDAQLIAVSRGFDTLRIHGNMTFGATDNIDDYSVIGEYRIATVFTITSGCSTNKTRFEYCTLTGVLSGPVVVYRCLITNLSGFQGAANTCIIEGTLTLTGSTDIKVITCYSGEGTIPELDMGGSGRGIIMRAYTGAIKIKNLSSAENIGIDFISGELRLDSTVTAGTIVLRGVGLIAEDFSTGTTIEDGGLTSPSSVSDQSWDEALADHLIAGSTGEKLDATGTAITVPKSKGQYEEDQL